MIEEILSRGMSLFSSRTSTWAYQGGSYVNTNSYAAEDDRFAADTLVFGMIESPAGVAAAADVLGVPGIDGTMIGTADLGASRTENDPPVADLVAEVHAVLAAGPSWRMDIVTGPDRAAAAFAAGADLVVYNLAHTLMGHLADLRAAHPGKGAA